MFTMAQQCVHCTVHNLIKSAITINFGNLLEACSKKLNTKWQKSLEPTIISQQILKNILKFITSLFIFILYSLDVVIKNGFRDPRYFIIINNQLRRVEIILQLCLSLISSVVVRDSCKWSEDIFRPQWHLQSGAAYRDDCRFCRLRQLQMLQMAMTSIYPPTWLSVRPPPGPAWPGLSLQLLFANSFHHPSRNWHGQPKWIGTRRGLKQEVVFCFDSSSLFI